MNMIQVDFDKIKRVAKQNRWSGNHIAVKSGLSRAGVALILKGKSEPAAVNLKKICDVIGLPIEEAFIEFSDAA